MFPSLHKTCHPSSSSKSGSPSISLQSNSSNGKKVNEPPTLPGELFQTTNFLVHSSSPSQIQQHRKITIYVDTQIGLSLGIYFEVVLTSKMTANDLIKSMLERINDLVRKLNNKQQRQLTTRKETQNFVSNEDLLNDEPRSFLQLRLLQQTKIETAPCLLMYKPLDSCNTNSYYLASVLYDRNEKVIPGNYEITSLSVPWSNGKFFLRERVF